MPGTPNPWSCCTCQNGFASVTFFAVDPLTAEDARRSCTLGLSRWPPSLVLPAVQRIASTNATRTSGELRTEELRCSSSHAGGRCPSFARIWLRFTPAAACFAADNSGLRSPRCRSPWNFKKYARSSNSLDANASLQSFVTLDSNRDHTHLASRLHRCSTCRQCGFVSHQHIFASV